MDISLKTQEYKALKTNKENSIEECVEAEFSLPEYMPEILRIIKTTAEPKVISCKLVDNKITMDGICEIRMIYTSEDGCVYSVSQQKQFTRHCENEEFSQGVDVNGTVDVGYVNCRATGTKKAEVKVGLTIKLSVYCEESISYVNLEECKGIEEKVHAIDVFSSGCKKTRSFSMSDTVTLDVPAAFILKQSASTVLSDVRKISNKIMLRGETVVELSYVNSENKALVERYIHSMPLNQIIEVDGLEETFEGNVMLMVSAVDVIAKGEQGNFNTAYDISVGIDASVFMWEKKSIKVITDAYGIDGELSLVKKQVPFCVCLDSLNDTFICDNSFSVSGEGVSAVLCESAEVNSVRISNTSDELTITGNLSASFIIKDNTGSLSNVNKVFDFSYKKACQLTESVQCELVISIVSLKTNVRNASEIDLRAELRICGVIAGEEIIDVLTDISLLEDGCKPQRMPITIYYPECENESLWDIARRYRTTVAAIAEENSLEGDTTEKSKILFIPSA